MKRLAILTIMLLGALTAGCGNESPAKPDTPPPLEIGEAAPAITAPNLDGTGDLSLADFHGEPVLLHVWASWCRPCRQSIRAVERYRGPVKVIGVNARDTRADALMAVDTFGIRSPQMRDPTGAVARTLSTTGIPEAILIDADGVVAGRFPGAFRGVRSVEDFVSAR